jgi:hypothetical protein
VVKTRAPQRFGLGDLDELISFTSEVEPGM